MTTKYNQVPTKYLVAFIILLVLFISPLPYYQSEEVICKPGQTNCPQIGWHFNPSIGKKLFNYFTHSSRTTAISLNSETYTNIKYGYSLSFPKSWNIVSASNLTEDNNGCYNIDKYPELIEISSQSRSRCSGTDSIASDEAEIIIAVFDTPWDEAYLNYDSAGLEKITFAGETATRFIFNENTERPAPLATQIIFNHAGRGYKIYVQQTKIGTIYNPSLDSILTTFKFTDSNISPASELLDKLNQALNADLVFKNEIVDDKTMKVVDLSDYYNLEFSKTGGKLDIIKQTLVDFGLVYIPTSNDSNPPAVWGSIYQSNHLKCNLSGNEEFLWLRCY